MRSSPGAWRAALAAAACMGAATPAGAQSQALPLSGAAAPVVARAQSLPLWEAGIGATALGLPDYRGSSESRGYLLPIPYFIYRGERVQVDRLGLRGALLRTPRLTLDFSFGAAAPVNSSDNAARAGMPDLDPLVEAGPSARIRLLGPETGGPRLDLRLPVRMAFAVSRDGLRDVGVVFNPHLAYDTGVTLAGQRWNLGLIAGVLVGDRRYHGYFYDVAPAYTTGVRPAFDAAGGYGGPQLLASVSRRFDRFWLGAFVRYDSTRGAAFEASPLVTARGNLSGGVAVSWIFATSGRTVDRSD